MKAIGTSLASALILAGCTDLGILSLFVDGNSDTQMLYVGLVQTPGPDTVRPEPRPDRQTPNVIPETAQSGELGRSVVSLGNPTVQGLWVETPLVSSIRAGRVIRTDTGTELKVELRPGPNGGARASLQTLLGLGLSPAALNELVIASP